MADEAHGSEGRVPDVVVAPRVFAFVGTFVGLMATLYWFTSYEEAGTAMLALGAVLSLWCATYLFLRLRRDRDEVLAVEGPAYLPHASPWPFGIGFGAFLLANGLLVGGWFFLPGAAVLVSSLGGFVRQTRHRT